MSQPIVVVRTPRQSRNDFIFAFALGAVSALVVIEWLAA